MSSSTGEKRLGMGSFVSSRKTVFGVGKLGGIVMVDVGRRGRGSSGIRSSFEGLGDILLGGIIVDWQ